MIEIIYPKVTIPCVYVGYVMRDMYAWDMQGAELSGLFYFGKPLCYQMVQFPLD